MTRDLENMKIEDDKIKSNKANTMEEIDDPKSTRGLEDHWEEFSESEEELEALQLIAAAEVELLKEYENNQMTSRSMEGPNTRGMESPNTRGMEEANGGLTIQEEHGQEMETVMNEEFDKLSESMNRKLQPNEMEDIHKKNEDREEVKKEDEELQSAGTKATPTANEEPKTPGKNLSHKKTPLPPPSKKRRLQEKKTPTNRKNPA